ncbi:luciferase family oxidoreductase group 1 [Luteococcus japonicus]|uniref:Luciferase family oxidoreductase group 1 n=1 Tax=Luteococcus japonicus TaxID=33984 RepID=A0A3N1ZT98_9ACTN|nr:LLM class flavin-dependent oxidoreductase [Luteococcus japonicus]ROR54090.1 luciferase family oxidoreductase group 1 [Luteococcus japonicus]
MPVSVPLSILDLVRFDPATEGPAEAIARSVRLAQAADGLGYRRLWFAEHHNAASIASSATSVLIEHVASQTERIRVGAGGVMLPNHSPLVIAEQFGMLESLHPGRIDLGLGRAPGTDQTTVRALRRTGRESDRFPEDVVELHGFLSDESPTPGVAAHPGQGTNVPLYILGSSLFGARLAAQLGLPYSFASHFAPAMLHQAAQEYRADFDPQGPLAPPNATPWFIAAANVIVSDDEADAAEQRRLAEDAWLRDFLSRGGSTPSDEDLRAARQHPQGQQLLSMLDCTFSGTQSQVERGLDGFADQVQADELILVNMAVGEERKRRTLELLAPAPR